MARLKRIFLYLLAIFFISSLTKTIFEYRKNVQFYYNFTEEYAKEKKRNTELRTQLVKTQDIAEFEKTARNKLNLHKKDEYVMVLPQPTPTVITPTPTVAPNYAQWIELFFYN
ncbi:MAG: septum formation initiator family protein [bacterium]|nr:septum formation initiator family protein [bacterium]